MCAARIRLGHALRGDAVEEAIDIALGTTRRVPVDRTAVDTTEQALGIAPDQRPVYAYVGDLNPSLGTVGLVVERSWCRVLTGVTRCDSGGLGGRRGAFNVLDEDEALAALRHLSFDEQTLPSWDTEFAQEVRRSYPATAAYVDGAQPDVSVWNDARAKCVMNADPPRDRRLWTWEARLWRGRSPRRSSLSCSAPTRRNDSKSWRRRRCGFLIP